MNELGFACWGMREMPLEAQLEFCGACGVRLTELDIANAPGGLPLDCDAGRLNEVKRAFERHGMPLWYVATGNDFTLETDEAVRAQVEKVCRVIELCAQLGVRWLRIFAGFSPAEEVDGPRMERLLRALSIVCEKAGEKGVCLVLETHGGVRPCGAGVEHFRSVSTRYDLLKQLLEKSPPDLWFLLDPANLQAAGEDPVRCYQLLKGRIAYIHAKEFVPLPGGGLRPAGCGAGAFDWAAFFAQIHDFDGPVMIEYEEPGDVQQGMRESLDLLRRTLQKTE